VKPPWSVAQDSQDCAVDFHLMMNRAREWTIDCNEGWAKRSRASQAGIIACAACSSALQRLNRTTCGPGIPRSPELCPLPSSAQHHVSPSIEMAKHLAFTNEGAACATRGRCHSGYPHLSRRVLSQPSRQITRLVCACSRRIYGL
jgi:hypothetical protein